MTKSFVIALFGSGVVCVGLFRLLDTFQTTGLAFMWGMITVVGLFMLTIGVGMRLDTSEDSSTVDATQAVQKTDTRF